jgi:hypothetical protein
MSRIVHSVVYCRTDDCPIVDIRSLLYVFCPRQGFRMFVRRTTIKLRALPFDPKRRGAFFICLETSRIAFNGGSGLTKPSVCAGNGLTITTAFVVYRFCYQSQYLQRAFSASAIFSRFAPWLATKSSLGVTCKGTPVEQADASWSAKS